MADQLAGKRALMGCRAYLRLHDAGPAGAPLRKDDLMGPRDDPAAEFPLAVEVLARFVDDTILDEPGHRDGEPHYALTTGMRDRMAASAEALRADLRACDAGEPVPEDRFRRAEAFIRTGREDASPL